MGSFWLPKTTDPHILANVECLDDRYPVLKIYISELIIYSYATVHCVAWFDLN